MLFRLLYFKVVILKHSQFQKHSFLSTNSIEFLPIISERGQYEYGFVSMPLDQRLPNKLLCRPHLIYNTLILLIQKVYILIMCPLKFKVIQYDINATFLLTMLGNVKLKGDVRPSCTSVDKNENIF